MIIKTQDELKAVYGSPNINNSIESVASFFEDAVQDFIIPYLSQAQYNKLIEDYNDNSTDEDHIALLKKVQKAAAHFGYSYYSDDGDFQLTDHGMVRIESTDEKTVYAAQVRRFKRARLRDGWNAIDNLLMFLDANKDKYTEWAESDEYINIKSFFIWNTKEYRKYRLIKNLGVLDALEGCAIHVQDEIIRRNIGDDLYTELKEETLTSYSEDNSPLLPFINKAIAHLIIDRAIDEGLVDFSDEGVTLRSFEDKDHGGEKADVADMRTIQFVKSEAKKKGEAAVYDLRAYLNKNASATKYASYFESDLYDDPTDTTDDVKFTNQTGGTFFAR